MTSHYQPLFASADLPPVPMPDPRFVKPKYHAAGVYLTPATAAPRALLSYYRRDQPLALLAFDTRSRWYLVTRSHAEADLHTLAITLGETRAKRWRIVEIATALIREEG